MGYRNSLPLNGSNRKRSRTALFTLALLMLIAPAIAQAPVPGSSDELLQYLSENVDWYRRIAAFDQSPGTTEEVLYRNSVRWRARQAMQLGFEFAIADVPVVTSNHQGGTTAASGTDRSRNLSQLAAAADARVKELRATIAELDRQIQSSATTRPDLSARRDELVAELGLATARRDTVQKFSEFVNRQEGGGAAGLVARIKNLQQSIPDLQTSGATTRPGAAETTTPAGAPEAFRPETAGILGLVSQMFTLSGRMGELKDLAGQAEVLRQANDKLRSPIRAQLQDAMRRADALTATQPSDDESRLASKRQQFEALTTRFRQLAAAAVPLSEQNDYLSATRAGLLDWRGALDRVYATALRYLLIRVGAITAAILVLLGISTLWKHATFRYVHDTRRRVQFLLLRRIVIGVLLVIVVVAGVVTEFGSLATYAGLLTAGLAVALQSVILSGAAYFLFLGRYGVRVGDRVTISGITGDVIDTGLFRLYLLELGGSGRDMSATGRIVVFSNSVLFQPSPFYKQIPGADYVWHEVALTLSPDSDYHLAEKRLLGAVESVFKEYGENIRRQHETARDAIHLQLPTPQPFGRLRFVDAGLEFVVRYPVEIRRAAEIDDRITRKLLESIEEEPKLKLVPSSAPKIQPADRQ